MNIKVHKYPDVDFWDELIQRPAIESADLSNVISSVFQEVENRGDEALLEFTAKFDKQNLNKLELDKEFINISRNLISEDLANAIEISAANITKFHKQQQLKTEKIETTPGVICWQESRALESVGLYIPGGTAPLFSTVLMLAIPAKIAGCNNIILCTPPDEMGKINPAIAYAASVAGITQIFTVGGAQAIAGLTLGTESIPKVQKIFGPGNQYVTAAKQFALLKGVGIDMPAGPSEVLVICSPNSDPDFVAADLLSQAEHGIDSQVICLSQDENQLEKVIDKIKEQLQVLPRKSIAEKALENSKFIALKSEEEIIAFSNEYAPEHLIIADDNFEQYIPQIINAGSVFLGNYCPESAGDYASGTNHTLPTAGFAKIYSGVNLDAFVKKITFQRISTEGIQNLGRTIELMAEAEGLHAHKNAVTLRLNKLADQ